MKVKLRMSLWGTTLASMLAALPALAGEISLPLTAQKIDEVWTAKYDCGYNKRTAVLKVIEDVGKYAATTTGETVAVLEEAVLSKILTMRVGTLDDRQEGTESRCEISAVECYLVAICHWPTMRTDRDKFLRIADDLARYKLLPDLSKTDAKKLAVKIDDYLKYGTNKPPFKTGWIKMWQGPVSEHVYKTMQFRELYNSSVKEMKQRVLDVYKRIALKEGFKGLSEEGRQQLWHEFLRRAEESLCLSATNS